MQTVKNGTFSPSKAHGVQPERIGGIIMIFADKLIELRKKNGWSQEELAERLNVTRQSVSKWEGAQSIPDLDKILMLAQIFGVTTDYLLKDEILEMQSVSANDGVTAGYRDEPAEPVRKVSMQEANDFLAAKESRKSSTCNFPLYSIACYDDIYGRRS